MDKQAPNVICGRILYEAIIGSMRYSRTSFTKWCRDYGVLESTAKMAAFGQLAGPKGVALVDAMIAAAGPADVLRSYNFHTLQEADRIRAQNAQALAA